MKRSSSRNRRLAFTLVELLVVIGIIAILAGIIGVSVGSAIKAAKRAKASSTATQLQTAVQSYYTEYSVYPTQPNSTTGVDTLYKSNDQASWANLTYALCGNVNAYSPGGSAPSNPVPNTRAIAFLSLSHSDLDSQGVVQNPFYTTGSTLAQYYNMAIDTDYSGVVGDSGTALGQLPNFPSAGSTNWGTAQPVPGGVAVWCSDDQPPTTTSASNPKFWSHTY